MRGSFFFPVLFGLTTVGCTGYVQERVVVADPYEPPPARVEVIAAAPAPGHVYERGHWVRHGREWVWVGGRWHRV